MTQTGSQTHVVIGDGWSALAAAGFLAQAGKDVCWISGTGARLLPPLPTVEAGAGAQAWGDLARSFGLDPGEEQPGSFLREFRNKAFREPMWTKAPDAEARREVQRETLWGAERFLIGGVESRFHFLTSGEIEEALRLAVLAHPRVNRIEGVPIEAFTVEEGQLIAVILASGVRIDCEQTFFADSWEDLPRIGGIPKPTAKTLAFLRKREPMGALQATFHHSRRIGQEPIPEGFLGSVHRETGEDFDRHLMGYFSGDGLRSTWTLCLGEAEVEDNHAIAKRLRRLKNALEKMFSGEPWTSPEAPGFLATVQSEQVRFAEDVLFGAGDPPAEPVEVSSISRFTCLTDGYGPSLAFELAFRAVSRLYSDQMGLAQRPEAKTEGVDLEPGLG